MKILDTTTNTSRMLHCIAYIHVLFFHLVMFTVSSTIAQKPTDLQCNNGWTLIFGKCYRYFNCSLTWHQANFTCNSYSGTLAQPIGYYLNKKLGEYIKTQSQNNVWIGYKYLKTNITEPVWSDGSESSLAFGLWDDNQPNLEKGRCGCLKYSETYQQWKWSLLQCDSVVSFICQMYACPLGMFSCGNAGTCLNTNRICDGILDCENGLDEINCPENCHFQLNQSEGEITETDLTRRISKSLSCQWNIEGRVGSKLQIWFESTDILQDDAMFEVWLGGRSIFESHLSVILKEPQNPAEYFLSYNNFAVIRLKVQSTEKMKNFKIKWLSDIRCSWIPFRHRIHLDTEPSYREISNFSKCLETCEKLKNCSLATINHNKGLCELHPMLPLSVKSSCCDSYVKSCPEKLEQIGSTDLLMSPSVLSASEQYQHIYSPLYPNPPPGDIVKIWKLEAPLWEVITLQIQDLKLSEEDKFIVYNGDISKTEILADTVNVTYSYKTPIISTKNIMYIKYKTGIYTKISQGFLAKFRKGCGFKVDSSFGSLSSPGYGTSFSYPPNIICEWEIITKSIFKNIKLEFQPKFGLERGKDFLEIFNGSISSENSLHEGKGFTGTTPPPVQTTNSGKFILRLKTSVSIAGIGFNVTFFSETYCGPVPILTAGRWINSTGFKNGDTATFKCFENFETKSENTINCKNGRWEPLPNCLVKTCSSLQPVIGGRWLKISNMSSFDMFQLVCQKPIYQISGYSKVVCRNGSWSRKPTCCREKCNLRVFSNVHNGTNMTDYLKGDSVNMTCTQGYKLVGKNPFICGIDPVPLCQNIDECSTNQTICPYRCIDKIGSYTCLCNQGYQDMDPLNKGKNCSDIDECLIKNAGCQQKCNNTAGSYYCTCKDGWELFVKNGQQGIYLHPRDTGLHPADPLRYNHSCVRVKCAPPQIENGTVLSLSSNFYFNDSVKVVCNRGYELVGKSTIFCQQNQSWTSVPECKEAICPPVETNSSTFKGTVSPSNYTKYGQIVNITCNTNVKKVYQQQCLYDLKNKVFSTLGENSECLPPDCGKPKQIPGMMIPIQLNCTHSGCNFKLQCLQPLFKVAGESIMDDQKVICDANGHWNFNNLTCHGPSCKDPGDPLDARQDFTSYEVGSLVNYVCLRPGYKPSPPYPLKCVVLNNKLQWNDSVPTCVDVQKPTFLNCPPKILYVEKMSRLNRKAPTAQDNSKQLKSVIVTPMLFDINQTIFYDTNVSYVAEDHAGNLAHCTFNIILFDHIPPKLECPENLEYSLHTDTVFKRNNFPTLNATDDSNSVDLTFEPEELYIKNKGSDTYIMKVTASDPSNNTASCYIAIKVKYDRICTTENLQVPNAKVLCSNGTGGLNCTVSCNTNYIFYHNINSFHETINCNSTNGWDREPPVCVEKKASMFLLSITYKYKTENITCIQNELMSQIFNEYSRISKYLEMFYNDKFNITTPSYLLPVETELKDKSVYATVRFQFDGKAKYYKIINDIARSRYFLSSGTNAFETRCTSNEKDLISFVNDYKCYGYAKFVQGNICAECPPGTYAYDYEDCLPCPPNTYNDEYGLSDCKGCPQRSEESQKGYARIQDCFAGCPEGTIVATGNMPCKLCPQHTYYINITTCKPCPPGKFTIFKGSTNLSHCLNECSPGYFSATGYEPCHMCPANSYNNIHRNTICTPCYQNQTSPPGSILKSNCTDINVCEENPCENGNCTVVRHHYLCYCSPGYTGKNCSIVIDPCLTKPCYHNGTCLATKDGKYECKCPSDFFGDNCENNTNHCNVESCKNNGVCHNLYNSFECICPSRSQYSGKFCNETTDLCFSTPCQNNGTCITEGKHFYCNCPSGYAGELCDIDVDECLSNPCLNNGTCTNFADMFNCTCLPGFYGSFCERIFNPCNDRNCLENSECIPDFSINKAVCVCATNYRKDNNGTCVPINSCTNTTCQNGGTCSENNGNVSCLCRPGYNGSLCMYDSKICGNTTCKNGSGCREKKGIYQCVSNSNLTEDGNICTFNVTKNCTDFNPQSHICLAQGIAGTYCKEYQCKPIRDDGICPCTPIYFNECDSKPCLNGATCYQTGNSSWCRCLPGYYGDRCQYQIDTCRTANHCIGSNSSCKMINNKPICICPKGFGGVGCLYKTLCGPAVCKNNGICIEKSTTISCICPLGFTGELCENITDPCFNNFCAGQKCKQKNNQAVCICSQNKWGKHCLKDIPLRSDFVFEKSRGFFIPMSVPDFSPIGPEHLTMTFWVKYFLEGRNKMQQTSATTLCLYGSDNMKDPVSSANPLVQLIGDVLSMNIMNKIYSFTLDSLKDGTWHHVILQWSNSDGKLLAYLNGKVITEKHIGSAKPIPALGLLVIGGTLDTNRNLINPSSFSGRMSQVWILNETLSKKQLQIYWKNSSQTPDNHIVLPLLQNMLMLPNYLLDFKFEAKQDVCKMNKNCSKINFLPLPYSVTCPPNQLHVSERWSSLKWNKAEFKNVVRIISNYEPEVSFFDWGDYTVIYIGYGQYNSSAVCTFTIFNRRFQCKKPTDPFSGTQECWEEKSSLLCKPMCNDANYKLALPAPVIYSCGPYHMWGKHNQSVLFKYPPCANVHESLKDISLEFSIKFALIFDESHFISLCELIQTTFKSVLQKQPDARCPAGDCKLTVTINGKACSSNNQVILRGKRSVKNMANIQTGLKGVVLSSNASLPQHLMAAIIDNKILQEKLVAMNASFVMSSLKPQMISYCEESFLQGTSCVDPGPGTFWSSKSNHVEPCPKGTYQPKPRSRACNSCSSDKTTKASQSIEESECKDICQKGLYFQSSTSKCTPCKAGFYQDQKGMFMCKGCKQGNTSVEGSTSETDCVKFVKSSAITSEGLSTVAIIFIVLVIILFFLLVLLSIIFWKKLKEHCPCCQKGKRISPIIISDNGRAASSDVIVPGKRSKTPEDFSPRISDRDTSLTNNTQHPISNIQAKSKETERTVQKIHLANYHANNKRIMVDSDEEDMR